MRNLNINKLKKFILLGMFLGILASGILPYPSIDIANEQSLRSSSVHDITIHSPEDTTYDGPMSGYYPAVYGFEDIEDGSMPSDWEHSSSVNVISQKSGHNKVVDLYDASSSTSASTNNSFTATQYGAVEFWVCISSISKAAYIKLYDNSERVQIEIRLSSGWISYKKYTGSYDNLEQYAANIWYHFQIQFFPDNPMIQGYQGGWYLFLDGILKNDIDEWEGLVKFRNLEGTDPHLNKLSYQTSVSAASYHFYVDAVGNNWDSDYELGANRCEGIFISFSCPTELIAMAYLIDNEVWGEITPYYDIVIPMRIGGGVHSIQIFGDDDLMFLHESSIRYFTIEEILDWGVDAINAEKVWGGYEDAKDVIGDNPSGQGINVLVIDTGVDVDHPDLVENLDSDNYGYDFSAGDPVPDDEYGHGTHCSGIIGAADNSIGILGVAPEVNLYAARVVDLNNQNNINVTAAREAIYWAIDNDIDIISMSFGGMGNNYEQACEDAYNAGIVLVGATGNDFNDRSIYPARNPTVIGVGAIKPKGNKYVRASFSNYGEGLELVAPGYDIYSTLPDGSYIHKSGTSMAAPMVAGVCALLLSKKPTLGPTEVREALDNSAKDTVIEGYNFFEHGHGLVDAVEALNYNFEGTIDITSPSDSFYFYRGENILFQAYAFDHDVIESVKFKIGSGSWQNAQYNPSTERYEWTWSNTKQYGNGWYTITCKLTDDLGYTKQDTISVHLETHIEKPMYYFHLKGSTYSGDLYSLQENDGNYLQIRGQRIGGWWFWTQWRSETDIRFFYGSYYGTTWDYEKIKIEIFHIVGTVKLKVKYTDGTYDWFTVYTENYEITLPTDKEIYSIIVVHDYVGLSAAVVALDLIWIYYT